MDDWRQLTVEQLTERYEQENYAPNMKAVLAGFAQQSEQARQVCRFEPFRYGTEAHEDGLWSRPSTAGGDVVVFVHGGAWRRGRAEDYLYPAPWINQAGMHYVSLNFANVLECQGQIFPMVRQVAQGLGWVMANAAAYGAAPRIHLVGHSSGAHLAACVATLDWNMRVPGHPDALRSLTLCSGTYDLEPVRHSGRSQYLRRDPTEVYALSPLYLQANPKVPVCLAVGEHESPEFLRHYRTMATKLQQAGVPLRHGIMPGVNHFEIFGTFGSAQGALAQFWHHSLVAMGAISSA